MNQADQELIEAIRVFLAEDVDVPLFDLCEAGDDAAAVQTHKEFLVEVFKNIGDIYKAHKENGSKISPEFQRLYYIVQFLESAIHLASSQNPISEQGLSTVLPSLKTSAVTLGFLKDFYEKSLEVAMPEISRQLAGLSLSELFDGHFSDEMIQTAKIFKFYIEKLTATQDALWCILDTDSQQKPYVELQDSILPPRIGSC